MRERNLSMVRPPISPTEYDGRTPWGRYLLQYEAVSCANGWDDFLRTTYLVPFLRGPALAYFETLDPSIRQNFSRLSEAFQGRFGTDYQHTVAHTELRSRLQKGGESLAEFATEIQRLTHLTFADCPERAKDRIALEQFLDGIGDLDIQERVRDAGPLTLQEALQTAARIEASHRATRAARRNIRAAVAQTIEPQPSRTSPHSGGRQTPTPTAQTSGNGYELE